MLSDSYICVCTNNETKEKNFRHDLEARPRHRITIIFKNKKGIFFGSIEMTVFDDLLFPQSHA